MESRGVTAGGPHRSECSGDHEAGSSLSTEKARLSAAISGADEEATRVAKGRSPSPDGGLDGHPAQSTDIPQHVAQERSRIGAYYSKEVRVISLGFLVLFSGYNSAQCLQSSMNATLGSINLGVMYLTASFFGAFTPATIEWLVARFRGDGRAPIVLGGLAYTFCGVFVCLLKPGMEADWTWALYITANCLLGALNVVMWTAQLDLCGRCAIYRAFAEAKLSGAAAFAANSGPADLARRRFDLITEHTTRYNAFFYGLYEASGIGGNIVAAWILKGAAFGEATRLTLFIVLGVLGLVGTAMFLLLRRELRVWDSGCSLGVTSQPGSLSDGGQSRQRNSEERSSASTRSPDFSPGRSSVASEASAPSTQQATPQSSQRQRQPLLDATGSNAREIPLRDPTGAAGNSIDDEAAEIRRLTRLPSPRETLEVATRDRRFSLVAPITFANGACLGFIFAVFPQHFVSPLASPMYVALTTAVFYAVNAGSQFVFDVMLREQVFGLRRFSGFLIATVVHLAYLVSLVLVLQFPSSLFDAGNPNFAYDPETGAWEPVVDPVSGEPRVCTTTQIVFLFGATVVFAVGDAWLESQVPASLQTLFANDPRCCGAMASYCATQNLGYAFAFFVNCVDFLELSAKIWILIVVIGVGYFGVVMLARTHKLD